MKAIDVSENEWNYLKDDGSYLLDEHVEYCEDFSEGFGRVQYYDNKYNFVNTEGEQLLKTNVYWCNIFENGFASILVNKVFYLIDNECNLYTKNKVSFKELYKEYPNMRSELIEIIQEYTYHDINEYFNI